MKPSSSWLGAAALLSGALGFPIGSGLAAFDVAHASDAPLGGARSGKDGRAALSELLLSSAWCRRSDMAVGFVLSRFEFAADSFTRTDFYVTDEGTVMRKISSGGPWTVDSSGKGEVSVHIHFQSISDSDAPKHDDEDWKRLDETTLQSLDGRKLHLRDHNSPEMICG